MEAAGRKIKRIVTEHPSYSFVGREYERGEKWHYMQVGDKCIFHSKSFNGSIANHNIEIVALDKNNIGNYSYQAQRNFKERYSEEALKHRFNSPIIFMLFELGGLDVVSENYFPILEFKSR